MKVRKLFVLSLLVSFLLVGCKKEEENLIPGELKTNTIMINKKGGLQMVLVEPFEKDYYKKDELEQFLQDIIKEYNNEYGEDSVLLDSILVEDGEASVLIHYESVNHYINLTEGSIESASFQEVEKNLPAAVLDINGKEVFLENITASKDNSKYKVLLIQEEYDVKVPGTILYYFNCIPLNNTMVHTPGDGDSIIIYK